ncbi:hypothetical protein B484DRAFT_412052, partial [Ochromonadaceae sp. CCMP2298]
MTSGGQFVTRCARGPTSHSTVSGNIVPDLYPVPLDCLLPRVQPHIYGCASAASIHALPPHIKFNLTAPQVQQLYSVGINPYPVGGWRNPGPGALPDALYDSDDPRLLRFQQEVHQRLEASGTSVSAATELRYTIPDAPTLAQAPATTSTIEPALIGQPTLATAQSTFRATAPTPTAPSGRLFVPPEGYWDGGTEYRHPPRTDWRGLTHYRTTYLILGTASRYTHATDPTAGWG